MITTTKDEISKIIKMRKVLESNYDLESISTFKTSLCFKKDKLYIIVNQEDNYLQISLDIFDNNEEISFETTFDEVLKIAKTFTKKADINVIINDNSVSFEALQDKDLVKETIMIQKGDSTPIRNLKGSDVSSIDLLTSLIACYKISKKMEVIADINSQIKISVVDNILNIMSNSNDAIIKGSFDFIGKNTNFYLEKENVKMVYSCIQESKSLTSTISIYEGLIIQAGCFIIWSKKSSRPSFNIESLIDNIETKLDFSKIENSVIDEANINKRDIEERICYLDNETLTSNTTSTVFSNISIIEAGYADKKISELLKIKSLELDELEMYVDKKYNILKMKNDFLTYYVLPQKKTN
jgi:hypothetical protein